jgi:lipid II:glycine glycyltransferase (peptidoglycan interpeptide bridge formation enzyme)
MPEVSPPEWDQFVDRQPSAHVLQTTSWGALKSDFGWQAVRITQGGCGAQILFRKLPFGLSMAYIPKGPLGDRAEWDRLWPAVDAVCKRHNSILLIVEPDLWTTGTNSSEPTIPEGFQPGLQSIQPPRTIVVNLAGRDSDSLARKKQKTRNNIRQAQKRGVVV